MEIDTEPVFRPWFKAVVCICFTLITVHVIVTGHLSPVRKTKRLTDKKSAEVIDGRLILDSSDKELYFPLLAYIPKNDVIDTALRKGVEVNSNGDVICILQIECPGVFNPVAYEERFVNFAALAIVTDTNCINAAAAENMTELKSLIGQMPKEEWFRRIGPRGLRLGTMAYLDAVTEVISTMSQAEYIDRHTTLE